MHIRSCYNKYAQNITCKIICTINLMQCNCTIYMCQLLS